MSLARNTYLDRCNSCGKPVCIQPRVTEPDIEDANGEKWVRCGECNKITLCRRVME